MEICCLPNDVLLDILMRLPVKPLIRFSFSSKQYLSLIHHPHFINRHLSCSNINPSRDDTFLLLCYHIKNPKYYSTAHSTARFTDGGKILTEHKEFQIPFKSRLGDPGLVRIVGSSNGLVCLCDTTPNLHPGDIILWNLIIGKFKKLPDSNLTHVRRDSKSHMVVGFGFVSETNDFKVVKILYDGEGDVCPDVWVYSMELDAWRKIEAIPPCSISMLLFDHMYVYVNGAVHWLAYKRPRSSASPNSIMSFDMGGEVFKELSLPNHLSTNQLKFYLSRLSASATGKTLSLFVKSHPWADVEVWLMQEYSVVDSWTRQFCIGSEHISVPLKFMDNGDVLLKGRYENLVSYDAENKQMNDHGRICGFKGFLRVFTWTSSLILLDRGEKVLG